MVSGILDWQCVYSSLSWWTSKNVENHINFRMESNERTTQRKSDPLRISFGEDCPKLVGKESFGHLIVEAFFACLLFHIQWVGIAGNVSAQYFALRQTSVCTRIDWSAAERVVGEGRGGAVSDARVDEYLVWHSQTNGSLNLCNFTTAAATANLSIPPQYKHTLQRTFEKENKKGNRKNSKTCVTGIRFYCIFFRKWAYAVCVCVSKVYHLTHCTCKEYENL